MISIHNNIMVREVRKAKFQPHFLVQLLIFIGLFLLAQFAGGLLIGVIAVGYMMKVNPSLLESGDASTIQSAIMNGMKNMPDWMMIVTLFLTAISIVVFFIYCRFIERRSWASLGFIRKNWLKNYLSGFLIGTLLIGLAALIAMIFGGLKFEGFSANISWVVILFYLIGFMIQGMSEEIVLRGYLMMSLSNKIPMAIAVALSSVTFAALHLMNEGISMIGFVNLILFGVFAAVFTLRTDNLWGIGAVHTAWNFVQGSILGVLVSGQHLSTRVLTLSPVEGKTLFSGGAFGLEGGLAVTAVYVAAILFLLYYPQKPRPEVEEAVALAAETAAPELEITEAIESQPASESVE
jgi:hypothetical protein